MRNWEDILKEKLEGYESPLPEGSLAEFRARRDQAAPAAKRYSPRRGWALAGAAAVAAAAGLAALLLPPRPAVPEDAIQIIQSQPVAVAVEPDAVAIDEAVPEPAPAQAQLARPISRKSAWSAPAARQEAETIVESAESTVVEPAKEEVTNPVEEPAEETFGPTKEPVVPTTASPFVPQSTQPRNVQMDVAPVAGAVAGGGLLAALLTPGVNGGSATSTDKIHNDTAEMNNSGNASNGFVYYNYNNYNSVAENVSNDLPQDVLTGKHTHYRPLKTGLSARIPLTEKLSVTTGLTYSLYRSKFTYSISGEKTQQAHYLGVPVRLDWTLAANRWLDVYVGAGVAGDLCLGSTLGGKAFEKDGPAFSVLGAGGLQWNILPRLGLYLEPELSWTLPSDKQALMTYRQEHPLVFTVATGLRITLGKQ